MTSLLSGVDTSVLDTLIAEIGGLDAGGSDLIAMYLDDADQRMGALRVAVDADNLTAVAQAAHGLRSSSALVGALRLAELLSRSEAMVRGGTGDVHALALEIEAEYQAVSADLHQLRLSA